MEKTDVNIRPYREGDEEGINNLFNRIFGQTRSLDEWRWKFVENPAVCDPAKWMTVIEKNGAIVGHYASVPYDIRYKGETVKAGQPVDTMIDAEAKLGLKALRELFNAHVEYNDSARFGFGFPNEKAYPVGKKLFGYQDLGRFVKLFRRLSYRTAIKRRFPGAPSFIVNAVDKLSRRKLGVAPGDNGPYEIREIKKFDERINAFWDDVKDNFDIVIARRSPYLNWRYCGRGFKLLLAEEGGKAAGYSVLRIDKEEEATVGFIAEIFAKDEAFSALLRKTLHFLSANDVDYVICGIREKDPIEEALMKEGFENRADIESLPVVYSNIKNEVDNDYLSRPEMWHLFYGEVDGF